jgi:hypothetical protein
MVGGGDEGERVHFASLICRVPARKVAEVVSALGGWYLAERSAASQTFAAWLRVQAGAGLDKDAARKAREALKARIEPICAIKPDQLAEADLRDLGADKLFSLDELGAGECMA